MTARLVAPNNNRLSSSTSSKGAGGAVEKKVRAGGVASHTPSRAAEGRRANKPLMEKRRRARINQSLAVLKTLILDSARLEQNTKHSKLEKADILELTVRHLQRQRTLGSAVLSKYRAGFQECAREVARFLDSSDLVSPPPNLDPAVKQRLVRHLESCVSELDLDFHLASEKRASCEVPVQAEADSEARPDSSTAPGDDNNNDTHLDRNHGDSLTESATTMKMDSPLDCALISRPGSSMGGEMLPQSCLVSASITPPIEALETVRAGANPLLSVVQVIPSRLPDGQVIFLLPSHYVQLAAAAAASSLSQCALPSTSSSTTTSILAWLPKTADQQDVANLTSTFQIKEEFESEENMTLEDQPIDFTVAKQKSEMSSFRDGSCSEAEAGDGDEGRSVEEEDQETGSMKDDESVWRPW